MFYRSVRENDGTYTIRGSVAGLNYNEIVKMGVRGCNVNRTINKLHAQDNRANNATAPSSHRRT